jgi:uncharacterized protein (DUF1800 family)
MTITPWAPYEPTKDAPWDLRRVVHLHRRAGFAATWAEIQRDLADGPDKSLTRVLKGERGAPLARSAADFESFATTLAESADDPGRLKAWWMFRMLFGADALTEKIALVWHNHFATSVEKVHNVGLLRRQNQTFRTLGRAPFGKLFEASVREPALLLYLDAPNNRKGHANENLARELMELFSLGVGNYTESDVKEAARALTGWTVHDDQFRHDTARHDAGEKTLLGRTGAWQGDDLVKFVLDNPATAKRVAFRLCEMLMGEKTVDDTLLQALAGGLREHNLDIGWAVETVLRSREFFDAKNLHRRVVGPVEFVVSAARALEMFDPSPSTLLLADWSARLGQDLFGPPNVGGWPGGRHWLTPRTLIGRANFASALVNGRLFQRQEPFDALGLARKYGRGESLEAVAGFYANLLLGGAPDAKWHERLLAQLGDDPRLDATSARRIAILTISAPEAQVG